MQRSDEALRRFKKATDLPLLVLALVFAAVIGLPEIQISVRRHFSPSMRSNG